MFDTAIVKNIKRETQDSVVVSLSLADANAQKYRYKQGQNLTFIRKFDDEELRRSYSICSSVNDAKLRVGIKQIVGGRFSTWANTQLSVGDELKLLPPSGHFYTELDPKLKRNYVGVAAGSGITPILSILKTTLETELESSFTLIYGNKSVDTIMFLEEIEDLKNRYQERFRVFNILSQEVQNAELLNGRIDGEKIESFLENLVPASEVDHVFLCGPFDMVMSAQDAFAKAGIAKSNIHTELFGTPEDLAAISANQVPKLSDEEAQHMSQLTVLIDGKGTKLNLARGGDSILDAALKIRKDLPFACKGGVCATCKAKVMEGEVSMDLNYSLSDEEVEQGFVLTCQSHPVSDIVVIDYDQK